MDDPTPLVYPSSTTHAIKDAHVPQTFNDMTSNYKTNFDIVFLIKFKAHCLYIYIRFYLRVISLHSRYQQHYHSHLALQLVRPWLLLNLNCAGARACQAMASAQSQLHWCPSLSGHGFCSITTALVPELVRSWLLLNLNCARVRSITCVKACSYIQ